MAAKLRCTINKTRAYMYNINTPGKALMGQFRLDCTNTADAGLDSELVCSIYKACNMYIETLYMKGIKA